MVQKENPGLINATGTSGWKKSVFGIIGAVIGALIMFYLLPADQLEVSARSLAALFVAALVLWVTESLPVPVTSLMVLAVMPLFKVYPTLKASTVGFYNTVPYFVIASFVLSYAVEKSGIGRRFALWLLSKTGTRTKVALLVFMVGCAMTSAIMSDVPSCAIWMSLALPILNNLEVVPGKSKLGKAFMMGIPIAALTGGVATPAGSSINILALSLLKDKGGIDVSFLQWMGIGVPVAAIMIFVAWFILIKVVKPEFDSIGDVEQFKVEHKELGKWNNTEIKTALIMAVAFVLWIASTWVKVLDISMVAILAAAVMFLPGIRLMSWKEAESNIGWGTVMMIGVVTSLGTASSDTGLSAWVVTNALGGLSGMSVVWITLIIAAFTIIIHLPIPINPAIVAAIIPPMLALAAAQGINPAIYILPVTFTTSAAFLLPLDAVTLVTYSKGYYSMYDMFLPGALISVVWIAVVTVLTVTLGPVLGF
ncbi:MAG: DASS family sodium-coupled anion symporter [Anaerofustis sp.]